MSIGFYMIRQCKLNCGKTQYFFYLFFMQFTFTWSGSLSYMFENVFCLQFKICRRQTLWLVYLPSHYWKFLVNSNVLGLPQPFKYFDCISPTNKARPKQLWYLFWPKWKKRRIFWPNRGFFCLNKVSFRLKEDFFA